MSYIDHDLGPEVSGPARPVTAQRTAAGNQPPLLDLQRLAGNAAVTSAIQSGRFDADLPIQRLDDDLEDEIEGNEEETSELLDQTAEMEEEEVGEEETESA